MVRVSQIFSVPDMSDDFKEEPILRENPGRFTLFPIEHKDVS